ncbi:PDR/VanB family oxidoreductase [Methylibium sp.]|uniref:PDR/VanB family oxidoreductase n=1 Tax=Methylibium sp. TaxID=2067992 RepID=UPI003D0BFBD6
MEHDWMQVKVTRKEIAAEGVVSFELRAADAGPLPEFSAGSHIDVELPNGMVRQYSLCNPSHEHDQYEIAVLLDTTGRGGSRSAHEQLMPGAALRIGAPRNHFALVAARRSILLAGGIGVTPILCMAERLTETDSEFEMHYCSRSLARTAFVQRIRSSAFSGRVRFHFDDGNDAQKLDTRAVLAAPSADTHLYVCGPKGFMDHVILTAKSLGWSEGNIHYEYFAGAELDRSRDSRFEVKLASTGQLIPVARDQSVIQALTAHGVEVPVSCEQGVCGTCVMRVIEGIPDHRDMYFTDAEHAANDRFTPCCSRAKSALLVIDF